MYVQLTYKYKNGSELFELTDQMTSRSSQNVTLIHVFLRFLVWKCKEKMQVRETLTRRIITGRAAKSNQSAPELYQQMTRLHYTENCAQAQGGRDENKPNLCERDHWVLFLAKKKNIRGTKCCKSKSFSPRAAVVLQHLLDSSAPLQLSLTCQPSHFIKTPFHSC